MLKTFEYLPTRSRGLNGLDLKCIEGDLRIILGWGIRQHSRERSTAFS
jgi:hypothetical protein